MQIADYSTYPLFAQFVICLTHLEKKKEILGTVVNLNSIFHRITFKIILSNMEIPRVFARPENYSRWYNSDLYLTYLCVNLHHAVSFDFFFAIIVTVLILIKPTKHTLLAKSYLYFTPQIYINKKIDMWCNIFIIDTSHKQRIFYSVCQYLSMFFFSSKKEEPFVFYTPIAIKNGIFKENFNSGNIDTEKITR